MVLIPIVSGKEDSGTRSEKCGNTSAQLSSCIQFLAATYGCFGSIKQKDVAFVTLNVWLVPCRFGSKTQLKSFIPFHVARHGAFFRPDLHFLSGGFPLPVRSRMDQSSKVARLVGANFAFVKLNLEKEATPAAESK